MIIINLTQHAATQEQRAQGVVDLDDASKLELVKLLTFDSIPSQQDMDSRAQHIALLAQHNCALEDGDDRIIDAAMIGGAPFFMSTLESALKDVYVKPVYAFSQRVSVEKEIDGKVVKTNEFKHLGFVNV